MQKIRRFIVKNFNNMSLEKLFSNNTFLSSYLIISNKFNTHNFLFLNKTQLGGRK